MNSPTISVSGLLHTSVILFLSSKAISNIHRLQIFDLVISESIGFGSIKFFFSSRWTLLWHSVYAVWLRVTDTSLNFSLVFPSVFHWVLLRFVTDIFESNFLFSFQTNLQCFHFSVLLSLSDIKTKLIRNSLSPNFIFATSKE